MMELWKLAPSVGWFYMGVTALALMVVIGGMIIFVRNHFRRQHRPEDQN